MEVETETLSVQKADLELDAGKEMVRKEQIEAD